ncbi:MAG TPA: 23S rRNA (pseudouridine(1915)-N(3))-methyltransferase RlmH [Hyphomicrobiaceae bacterium]|jgi:23S rRNA (pseudouridine1915-N3)-methyltransferase|nr:23S rRNA (pseudouridine(1915)-N(3))-methyltransferase RlmH [Hyphomicrobiaceae bacterium]
MRVVIAAIGRLKDGPERVLFERYRGRFEAAGRRLGFAPVECGEAAESQAASVAKRKTEEAAALRKLTRDAETVIALDAAGKACTSAGFAELLAKIRDEGSRGLAFAIGGPDGLAADILGAAKMRLSFGTITLPHQLARIVLAEQLYRAATILAGHPYHRA